MPEDATVRESLSSMDQPLMNRCWTRPDAPKWDSSAQDGRGPSPLPAGLGRLVRKGSVQLQAQATIYASTTAARSEEKPDAILDCHGGKVRSLGVSLG